MATGSNGLTWKGALPAGMGVYGASHVATLLLAILL